MIRCLSFHAAYRCRHAGACCRAGWTIPFAEAEAAVRRAEQAAVVWGGLAPADRARLLRSFAGLIDRDLEVLAQLEVAEAFGVKPATVRRWDAWLAASGVAGLLGERKGPKR